jgi:hypothetical protein
VNSWQFDSGQFAVGLGEKSAKISLISSVSVKNNVVILFLKCDRFSKSVTFEPYGIITNHNHHKNQR